MRVTPVGQPHSFKEIHQRLLCGAVEAVTGEIHNWVAAGYTIVVAPPHSLFDVTLLSMLSKPGKVLFCFLIGEFPCSYFAAKVRKTRTKREGQSLLFFMNLKYTPS